LCVVAIVSRFAWEPNSLSLRFFIIAVSSGWLTGGLRILPRAPGQREGVASSAENGLAVEADRNGGLVGKSRT
jgi:hypothetical protein